MADEAEDLVSQIRVTGSEAGAAEITAFADKGAAAFDRLNKSANASAKGVAGATTAIGAASKAANTSIAGIGSTGTGVVSRIEAIKQSVSDFTAKLPQLTQAVGRFSQRLALVGAAGATAAVGLGLAARNVAKSLDGENTSLQKNTASQIDANNAALTAETAQINHASSLRQLSQQLATGKITYDQYRTGVKDLNTTYAEQKKVAAQVAAAQDEVKEANDRLQKSLKDQTALNALIDKFGGPLLTSLSAFGREVENVRTRLVSSLGPSAAAGIDVISGVLTKNSTAIDKFFSEASKRIDEMLKNNGPELTKMLETLGRAASSVFLGLIDAAPGIIKFFNDTLVPAINRVSGWFTSLSEAINSVFGTKLTGGGVFLIVLLAQMTGSVRLLFSLFRVSKGVFNGFVGIITSIGVAIAEAFGFKTAASLVKVGGVATKVQGPFKQILSLIQALVPVVRAVGVAFGVGLGPATIIVGLLAAAAIYLIKNVDWTAFWKSAVEAAKGIQERWNALVLFFKTAPANISTFFGTMWQGIKDGGSAAAQWVIDAWNGLVTFFTTTLPTNLGLAIAFLWEGTKTLASDAAQWVITKWNEVVAFFTALPARVQVFFTTLWNGTKQLATDAAQWVTDKWNAVVEFFRGLPDMVSAFFTTLWTNIKQSGFDAFEALKKTVNDWVVWIKAKLKPVTDLLDLIRSKTDTATGGGDGGGNTVSAAGGGHIRGRGTSTSDSIAAWLSNNEFVMKAKAVAKYGVGFMQAVNSGKLDLRKMLGFAAGGLVGGMTPRVPRLAYASGGAVRTNASRVLNLSIGGENFNGILMPEDVAEKMTRFAVGRQLQSAGRKPGWVGGNR